jgi:50S ribosomal protein L16 3-hydroxylase
VSDEDGGNDATLLRRLADDRHLSAADLRKISRPARKLLAEWQDAGWLQGD